MILDKTVDLAGFRVLFVYPSHRTKPRIPLAISILIAQLKKYNARVRLLDTTFMMGDPNYSDRIRADIGYVKKSDIKTHYGHIEKVDIEKELIVVLKEFSPQLIAMSFVEHNYSLAMRLLDIIKKNSNVPTLLGGIMPTVAPEMILESEQVDMVCVGEGEEAIIDVCHVIQAGRPCDSIKNIWCKDKVTGQIKRNPIRPLMNMDEIPFQDWSCFDDRSLYKAFCGKAYRCGSFELTRGCLKRCSFCVAPALRKRQGGMGGYRRKKSPKRLMEEILTLAHKYKLEMVHFCDTEFLSGIDENFLREFTDLYKRQVGLPFIIQTGVESITDGKLVLLKEAGCKSMSIGIESGDEGFRKRILKKYLPDRVIFKGFDIAERRSIRTTANYMIGLPFETEELILKTIEFNKRLKPPSISVCYFVPFLGTELYDLSIKEGFYPKFDPDADIFTESSLNLPNLSKQRIKELMELFVREQNKIEAEKFL